MIRIALLLFSGWITIAAAQTPPDPDKGPASAPAEAPAAAAVSAPTATPAPPALGIGSTGILAGLALLAAAVGAFMYLRRRR